MTVRREPIKSRAHRARVGHLGSVQVGGVFHRARFVAIVSVLDNRVKELSKHLMERKKRPKHLVSSPLLGVWTQQHTANMNSNLIALLISGHHAHSLDEGVPRVVHPSLDALVQGPVIGGCLVPQAAVDGRGQRCCHAVVVLPQVRVVCTVDSYRRDRSFTSSPALS